MLNIRNTPTQGHDNSQVQRFLSRRTKSLISITNKQLEQQIVDPNLTQHHIKNNQERQAKYYNRSAHNLPILNTGDTVRMQPFQLGQSTWKRGEITRRLDERSYEVVSDGHTYRRTRQHLRKSPNIHHHNDIHRETVPPVPVDATQPARNTPPVENTDQNTTQQLRRSDRKTRPPQRLVDFVPK